MPPDWSEQFLELQRGDHRGRERCFPRYQVMDVYPRSAGSWSGWWSSTLTAPRCCSAARRLLVRAEWIEKLRNEMGDFRSETLPTWFCAWFASLAKWIGSRLTAAVEDCRIGAVGFLSDRHGAGYLPLILPQPSGLAVSVLSSATP